MVVSPQGRKWITKEALCMAFMIQVCPRILTEGSLLFVEIHTCWSWIMQSLRLIIFCKLGELQCVLPFQMIVQIQTSPN